MKETRLIMGMPITIEIVDPDATEADFEAAFAYFEYIDDTFSPFKEESEISRLNRGELSEEEYSADLRTVLDLSEKTKRETDGYFDIVAPDGSINPSGLVKGWAIYEVAKLLRRRGLKNFYVNAGGDIEAHGEGGQGPYWKAGIRHPFEPNGIAKVVYLKDCGIATSGIYLRGQHIYDPHRKGEPLNDIVSLSVIGPDVYEADRFATAAFAMGRQGIAFIEGLPGFEGYLIDKEGKAAMTRGFSALTQEPIF